MSFRAGRHQIEFGLKTTPLGVSYEELLRVWREADQIPTIDHAWLWDHLMPLRGDRAAPVLEGWTLLAALAAQTRRLRLGLIVTNNLIRNPALLAKMAATVDVVSNGRLEFGIGAGGNTERESAAFGLDAPPIGERAERLEEACELLRLLWAGDSVDLSGRHYSLAGAVCRPLPVQRPAPPILIGGAGERRTLPLVARHADAWNFPGPPYFPVAEFARESRVLDELCAEIGRSDRVVRSLQIGVDLEQADRVRETALDLLAAGADQLIFALAPPYSEGAARRLVDEVIAPIEAVLPIPR